MKGVLEQAKPDIVINLKRCDNKYLKGLTLSEKEQLRLFIRNIKGEFKEFIDELESLINQ